jgi:hypothetical protein
MTIVAFPERTSDAEWRKVGEVGIDTASLLLCDPCNAYDDVGELERRHLGAVVSTGLGDGSYDVLVREYKGYTLEVRVVFTTKESVDEVMDEVNRLRSR